jgi:hypothetical protein
MKTENTECSETSAPKFRTPEYHPKERIREFDLVSVWRGICYIFCLYAPCNILYPIPWGIFVFSDVYFLELQECESRKNEFLYAYFALTCGRLLKYVMRYIKRQTALSTYSVFVI